MTRRFRSEAELAAHVVSHLQDRGWDIYQEVPCSRSPWRRTCKRAADLVRDRPGVSLKNLVESIDHHYANTSSARANISYWARAGKIDGVECRREGRFLRLYPGAEVAT